MPTTDKLCDLKDKHGSGPQEAHCLVEENHIYIKIYNNK